MNVSDRPSNSWRSIFKAVIIYVAGAWAAIEVVDFFVTKYGLSRLLLDASVVVAFGGGMITAVLAWFHSEPGQQTIKKPEVAIVSTVVLMTAAGVAYLATLGPAAEFDRLDGYRLILEFRQYPGDGEESRSFGGSPMQGAEIIDEGFFYYLDPDLAFVKGPTMDININHYPVMFHWDQNEWVTITIVLPSEPATLAKLRSAGPVHDRVKFAILGLKVDINERFELLGKPSEVTLRFND